MNGFEFSTDLLLMLLPVIAIQLGLFVYSTIKIFTEGVRNLSRWGWFFICLFGSMLGPIIFLIAGRKREA
jgi:hypothetical protein